MDAGVVEGEVDAGFALGVGPGAVGGAVGGGSGFAFTEGRGEDGFDLGGGEERARCGELGVQGMGEGEGGEGEDGWDEGEEAGCEWGHGGALWWLDAPCAGGGCGGAETSTPLIRKVRVRIAHLACHTISPNS